MLVCCAAVEQYVIAVACICYYVLYASEVEELPTDELNHCRIVYILQVGVLAWFWMERNPMQGNSTTPTTLHCGIQLTVH